MTEPITGQGSAANTPAGALRGDPHSELSAAFRAVLEQHAEPASAPKPRTVGKNEAQLSRDETARRRSPWLDPTAAALAELTSPGAVKPLAAEAQAIQAGHADAGDGPAPASAKPAPRPSGQSRPEGPPQRTTPNPGSKEQPAQQAAPAQPVQAAPQVKGAASKPAAKPEPAERQSVQRMPGAPQNRQAPVSLPRPAATRTVTGPSGASSGTNAGARIQGHAPKTADLRAALKPDKPQPRFKLEPEDEKVAAQFGRGLAAALRQNGGSVTIRLQPEALGDLKIKMSLEPGKVAASFEVQSDQARQLLGKTMDTLRSALEARGLEVDRLDVQVADRAHLLPIESGQNCGGAGADPGSGGQNGSEHPEPRMARAMPTGIDAAEPTTDIGPWMGLEAGGALRIRLDALA